MSKTIHVNGIEIEANKKFFQTDQDATYTIEIHDLFEGFQRKGTYQKVLHNIRKAEIDSHDRLMAYLQGVAFSVLTKVIANEPGYVDIYPFERITPEEAIDAIKTFLKTHGISLLENLPVDYQHKAYRLSIQDMIDGIQQKGTGYSVFQNIMMTDGQNPQVIRAMLRGMATGIVQKWAEGRPDYQMYRIIAQ